MAPASARPVPGAGRLWPAYSHWRVAAGPLADFVSAAPFVASQDVAPQVPRHRLARRLARGLAVRAAAGAPGAVVFLEAAPRLALAAGHHLLRLGWAVAPLIARWPAADGVLPAHRLAQWLATLPAAPAATLPAAPPATLPADSWRPPSGWPACLCVLLDAERSRPVSRRTLRRRFDNRYGYLAHMLPPAARLGEWGASRVLFAGQAAGAPADLQAYLGSLVAAGLVVDFVAVSQLCERGALS
jgi:hypothetical protein